MERCRETTRRRRRIENGTDFDIYRTQSTGGHPSLHAGGARLGPFPLSTKATPRRCEGLDGSGIRNVNINSNKRETDLCHSDPPSQPAHVEVPLHASPTPATLPPSVRIKLSTTADRPAGDAAPHF